MPSDRFNLRPYRAVIFDFFGTLTYAVRRGPAHAAVARRLGCDPHSFTAVLDATFRARARGEYGSVQTALRQVALAAGGRPNRRQVAMATPARLAAVRADIRLRHDAVPVLRAIRARGLRTALVTDCAHELPPSLPALPIAPLLDACVFSVQVGACKPDSRIYLAACRRLGVAPHECLYVGDGGGRELTGATAVGMHAVRLAAPDLADHLTFEPDIGWVGPRVERLADVLRMVDCEPCEVVGASA